MRQTPTRKERQEKEEQRVKRKLKELLATSCITRRKQNNEKEKIVTGEEYNRSEINSIEDTVRKSS